MEYEYIITYVEDRRYRDDYATTLTVIKPDLLSDEEIWAMAERHVNLREPALTPRVINVKVSQRLPLYFVSKRDGKTFNSAY